MPGAILIVDPQYDFISGSLPVPGAVQAMGELAANIAANGASWVLKIITCDFHPWNHCSFKENGGQWPRHCVAYSKGAAVWQDVLEASFASPGNAHILCKGEKKDVEEYSIFQANAAELDRLFAEHHIDQVDICGLAGDICVLTTLKDGIGRYGAGMFRVLTKFSPSLDGGQALAEFCGKERICDR